MEMWDVGSFLKDGWQTMPIPMQGLTWLCPAGRKEFLTSTSGHQGAKC